MKNSRGVYFEKTIICACGLRAKYRDYTKRIVKNEYGRKRFVLVPRYICPKCGKFRKLPNTLIAYKHYRRDIISGFVNGDLTHDSLEYEDYPCEMTTKRWSQEFPSLL